MTLPTQPIDILELARKYRAQLERNDALAIQRLVNSYGAIYERIQDKLDLLLQQIADGSVKGSAIKRLSRYKELMQLINRELNNYQVYSGMEMQTVARNAVEVGVAHAQAMAWTALVISAGWNNINPRVIETLTGYLAENGALYKRLEMLAPTVADKVAQVILEGVGIGQNPVKTARDLVRNAFGIGLTDSIRMMRTLQIYSYREANRASYIANSDVVQGWYWMSALDANSCMSCIAMHGTFHTNDEVLDDHHNGLCTMLPATIGSKNPLQAGEAWFKGLSDAEQQRYMGTNKWQAWKDGKFEFGALSTTHDDPVYGQMRTETPLKDLIND